MMYARDHNAIVIIGFRYLIVIISSLLSFNPTDFQAYFSTTAWSTSNSWTFAANTESHCCNIYARPSA